MRICILTPRYPFPENGGDVLRINNIARYLKSKGHELILVSFYENSNILSAANELYNKVYVIKRNRFLSLFYSLLFLLFGYPIQCGFYFSYKYKRLLKNVMTEEKPDLFIAHLLRMTPYLESLGVESLSVVEMTDALSKTYGMSTNAKGNLLKRLVYNIERPLIEKYENHVISTFPKVVLVSQSDIDYLNQRLENKANSLVLHTNGVECPHIQNKNTINKNKICFIGNMRTLQNEDAVIHFVNNILPIIKNEVPTIEFHIVGAEPTERVKNLADNKSIFVTGFVEDLQLYLSDACVVVAPVRIAAGIQNKVLISMAYKLPVVLSTLISKAIPELQNRENCFICDDVNDFATVCVNLMNNNELRTSIAIAGYNVVYEKYSWANKLEGYEIVAVR